MLGFGKPLKFYSIIEFIVNCFMTDSWSTTKTSYLNTKSQNSMIFDCQVWFQKVETSKTYWQISLNHKISYLLTEINSGRITEQIFAYHSKLNHQISYSWAKIKDLIFRRKWRTRKIKEEGESDTWELR